MQYKYGKLFKNVRISELNIEALDYDTSNDYYSFVHEKSMDGYQQVLLTSEIMLFLLDYFVIDRGFKIDNIEFLEDDSDLANEMNIYIEFACRDRARYKQITEKLEFISNNSSIDIKKISISCKESSEYKTIFFQVNGVIGIDFKNYVVESDVIVNEVKRYLNND